MFKLGTNNIDKIYLGDTKIAKAYLGDTLVYESAPAHDYSQDYLTLNALTSGTFTINKVYNGATSQRVTSISYSTNNGNTWTTTNWSTSAQTITINLGANDTLLLKGIANHYATNYSTYDSARVVSFKFTAVYTASYHGCHLFPVLKVI